MAAQHAKVLFDPSSIAAKNESVVHMIGVMANFGYEIQNSVAMTTSLANFSDVTEIADPQATSRCKSIEHAVHKAEIMTTFI